MAINPESYGPGRLVSGAMMENLVKEHGHKIIIILMLRLGVRELLLNQNDMNALIELADDHVLIAQPRPEGIYLKIGKVP